MMAILTEDLVRPHEPVLPSSPQRSTSLGLAEKDHRPGTLDVDWAERALTGTVPPSRSPNSDRQVFRAPRRRSCAIKRPRRWPVVLAAAISLGALALTNEPAHQPSSRPIDHAGVPAAAATATIDSPRPSLGRSVPGAWPTHLPSVGFLSPSTHWLALLRMASRP